MTVRLAKFLLLPLTLVFVNPAFSQFTLRTAAGGGPNNIPGVGANSNSPQHLAFAHGNLYIADAGENRIFKLDQGGMLHVIAGSGWADPAQGAPTGDGGPAVEANVVKPSAVAVDPQGVVYFVDIFGLRKVDATGTIATLPGTGCLNYDPFNEFPLPIALDPTGKLLYCVTLYSNSGSVVSQVNLSTLAVTPFAGGGSLTQDNIAPTLERLWSINGLAADAFGDIYIACLSCAEVYKVSNGLITHIAGGGAVNPQNVLATSAQVDDPIDVAVDSANNVYVSLLNNASILRIDGNSQIISQYAGAPAGSCLTPPFINDGGSALNACFTEAIGMTVDTSTNNLYFSDSDGLAIINVHAFGTDHLVRRISPTSPNVIDTVVGNVFPPGLPLSPGQAGGFEFLSGDDFLAMDARIGPAPQGLAVDPSGNLYIGDYWNYAVRRVDAVSGVITSITPNPGSLSSVDPFFIAVGPDGTVYANTASPESSNPATIWSIKDGVLTSVASYPGAFVGCTYTPDGAPANSGCIGYPQGIALDGAGNMYVADEQFCTIREISPAGILGTVTGIAGTCNRAGDGGPAALATVGNPLEVAAYTDGTVWFADFGAQNQGPGSLGFTIRKISADRSMISTVWQPLANTTELQALTVDTHGNGLLQIYSPAAWGGICGDSGYCIIQISATDSNVTEIAGGGPGGLPSLDGVPALGATLGCLDVGPPLLGGMAVNANNQIFFVEGCSGFQYAGSFSLVYDTNAVVRRLDPPAVEIVPSADVSVTASGLAYSRVTQTFNGTVTLINTSSTTQEGPLQILLTSLTANVQLSNAAGNYNGSPFLTASATNLGPGQSVTVSVQFKNPSNLKISFTPVIYSGSL